MEDYLQEIVSLAYQYSPVNTEYYFSKLHREYDQLAEDIQGNLDNLNQLYDKYAYAKDIRLELTQDISRLTEMMGKVKNHFSILRLGNNS